MKTDPQYPPVWQAEGNWVDGRIIVVHRAKKGERLRVSPEQAVRRIRELQEALAGLLHQIDVSCDVDKPGDGDVLDCSIEGHAYDAARKALNL